MRSLNRRHKSYTVYNFSKLSFGGLTLVFILTNLVITPSTIWLSQGTAHASTPYLASDVLGQPDFTTNTEGAGIDGLTVPNGTDIDFVRHRLFVADQYNHRVVIYNLNSANDLLDKSADYVLGQPDFDTTDCLGADNPPATQSGMCYPYAVAYDASHNRLYVSDDYNYRVLVFDLDAGISNGMNASYVLGQEDFTGFDYHLTQDGLYGPLGLAYDVATDYLYVVDDIRVLVYDTNDLANGMDATYVLGQPDFETNIRTTTQSGMDSSWGVSIDDKHHLFVDDYSNCRVQIFDTTNLSNGMDASYVLGQPDFDTADCGVTKNTMGGPVASVYDPLQQYLFVAEYTNNRILVYNLSGGITNGMDSIGVVGQADFTSNNEALDQSSIIPYDMDNMTWDSGNRRLWVPDDYYDNRILIFNFANITTNSVPSGKVGNSYSKTLSFSGTQGTTSWAKISGSLPPGIVFNSSTHKLSGTPTDDGTYHFTIKLSDDNGTAGTYFDKQAYTLKVLAASTSSGGGSSSGSGSSSGTTSYSSSGSIDTSSTDSDQDTTDTNIILNDFTEFTESEGKSLELNLGDILHFCLSIAPSDTCNVDDTDIHSITLKDIDLDNDSATLSFASTPFAVTFEKGTDQDVDIDQDGTADINVLLNSLSATTANFSFKYLAQATGTAQPTNNTNTNTQTPKTEKTETNWLYYAIPAATLLFLAGWWTLRRAGRNKRPPNLPTTTYTPVP